MTKENMDLWSFVFNGFTAVGTVGAVIISLWFTLRKTPNFIIRDIQVSTLHTMGADRKIEKTESDLLIQIENTLDVQMQVFKVALRHTAANPPKSGLQGGGTVYPLSNTFIPPRSRYFVKIPLQKDWDYKSCSGAKSLECEVSTSFGDKTLAFPKQWIPQLSAAVEKMETENK